MANGRVRLRQQAASALSGLSFLVYAPLARFLGALLVALVPLVLGYLGFQQYLSRAGWSDLVFYDLQLPILAAAPVQGTGPYPVDLGVARLLAPVVAGLATVATARLLLAEQLRRWSAAAARQHAVVVGDGPVAIGLARRLRAERVKVVLVGLSDTTLAWARTNGLLAVRGEPADPGALRAAGVPRARELYACTDSGTVNAAVALRARDEVRPGRRAPLAAYALVRDIELRVSLQARRIGAAGDRRLRLDFFDVAAIAARRLLDEHPLTRGQDQPSVAVIVGFGQLGRAVLLEIAQRHPPGSPKAEVLLRQADAAAFARVAAWFPAIEQNCQVTAAGPELTGTGPYTVFVCLDSDDDALREGLAMAHALASRSGRVIVCLREEAPFAGVIAATSGLVDDVMGRLSVFGVLEEACVPANIRDDFTERLARSVHAAYCAQEARKGNTPQSNASMVPWEQLPEDLRQSNIAQAADVGRKMAEIGAVVIPATDDVPSFAFTDGEVDRLAKLEHKRWVDERKAKGWKYGPDRDDAAKIHPDLRDWPDLSQESKDKDRDAVRAIPEDVHDAGFQILRLPPP